MREFIIMGVQGCGKGTQAKMLAQDFDLVHISVGDIFRWHIQSRTKLAARIRRLIAAGELVPDDIVEEVVKDRLDQHDWNYGFILDGFPRNRRQAEFFLESYDINAVILIDVPDEVVLERIVNRRLCSKCGLDYNLIYHHPRGGRRVRRVRGRPGRPRRRHARGRQRTRCTTITPRPKPILDLFRRKELIVTTDGTRPAADVQQELRRQLNLVQG